MYYNGAAITIQDPVEVFASAQANGESAGMSDLLDADGIRGPVPFFLELRAHYTNFMVNWGVEYNYKTSGLWREYVQFDNVPCYEAGTCIDPNSMSTEVTVDNLIQPAFQETAFAKSLYVGVGYLFGAQAGEGLGPRVALRYTDVSIPHGFAVTSHLGWGFEAPFVEKVGGKRNRLFVDADIRFGAHLSQDYSLSFETTSAASDEDNFFDDNGISGIFGFTLAAGATF